MKTFVWALSILGILSGSFAQASSTQSLTTKPAIKKKVQETSGWNFGLGYSGMTDLLDEMERTYSHSVEFSAGYVFSQSLSAGAFAGLEYDSIGNEIVKEENTSPMGDSGINLGYVIPLIGKLNLQNSITEVFPTSEASKMEGYKSIVSVKSSLPVPFPEYRLTFVNTLGYSYIVNTYEYSAQARTANPQWTTSYSITPVLGINKYFSIGASLDVRSTRFLDETSRFRSGNVLFVSGKWQRFSSRLAYTNGVVPDPAGSPALDSLQTLQIDNYRQIVTWELSCAF
jgi:hypothetical protein